MKALCLQCQNSLSRQLTLSLGALPACNRFEKQVQTAFDKHPLSISVCAACNLVQLSQFPPIDFVRPRVPWIRYNEPEAHLGQVTQRLLKLLPINATKVIGVGPFDTILLDQLADHTELRIMRAIAEPMQISADYFPYLESIQELLRPDQLSKFATKQGTADLVSCRYLLEHSHAPIVALQALRHLMKPDGLLLIEIPDSSKFMAACDYSYIWEEHICYFTEATFHDCATRAGYQVVDFYRHEEGVLEDALVFVLRATGFPIKNNETQRKIVNTGQFEHYISQFVSVRARYQSALKSIQDQVGKVALFGAGHQSIMFINALELQSHIACVIDDSLNKEGSFIPGTSIPIVSSERFLADQSISVCLLGINPALEDKIKIKCAAFLDRGGKMYSIFPGSSSGTLIDQSDRLPVNLIKKTSEVYLAPGPIAAIGSAEINFLKRKVAGNKKGRVRINFHQDNSDLLHEMMIAIRPDSYIRPHKHPDKSEPFHIIYGAVDIVVFEDDGTIREVVSLAAKDESKAFYYHMSRPFFHTLIINSDLLVVHEITNGPFAKDGAIFGSFAPAESASASAITAWQNKLIERIRCAT